MITTLSQWLQLTWATLITDVQQHAALILVSVALILFVAIISWNTLSPINVSHSDENDAEYW